MSDSWLIEIDRLRAELANMSARAEAIIASENRLRAENVRMNAKNNVLICDNGRLRAECEAKTEALDSVLAEHAKVGPELERLRAEKAELEGKIIEMMQAIRIIGHTPEMHVRLDMVRKFFEGEEGE